MREEKIKLEEMWEKALTGIMEDLSCTDYKKFQNSWGKIPKSKISKNPVKMAHQIVTHYGTTESVVEVNNILNDIPRRDFRMRNKLKPFLKQIKLKSKPGSGKGKHREAVTQSDSSASDTESDTEQSQTDEKCGRPENVTSNGTFKPEFQFWRQTIQDLNNDRGTKPIIGVVVEKSRLIPYGSGKVLFYMALVDETDCIKVIGYDQDHYATITKGKSYMFRDYARGDGVLRVTSLTITSEVKPIAVPPQLTDRARELFRPAVCSIARAGGLAIGTVTSVEGTILKVTPREVLVKGEPTEQSVITLRDQEGERVNVTLWSDLAKHHSLSIGNQVKLMNVKANRYMEEFSLSSTLFTTIDLMESAALQNATLLMVAVHKTDKCDTSVECTMNEQMQTYIVKSEHLADHLDLVPDDTFKTTLLDKLPLRVSANIQGNQIMEFLKVHNKEMKHV